MGRGRRTGPGGKRRRRRDFDNDNWGMRERGCGFAIVRRNTCCPAFPSTTMYPPNPMCCLPPMASSTACPPRQPGPSSTPPPPPPPPPLPPPPLPPSQFATTLSRSRPPLPSLTCSQTLWQSTGRLLIFIRKPKTKPPSSGKSRVFTLAMTRSSKRSWAIITRTRKPGRRRTAGGGSAASRLPCYVFSHCMLTYMAYMYSRRGVSS